MNSLLNCNSKNNIAITMDSEESLTYDDLRVFIAKFGKIIKPRSLIFCLSKNSMGSVVGYISFIENNLVPLVLGVTLNKRFLENLIKIYNPKYLWTPNNCLKNFSRHEVLLKVFDYSLLKISSNKINNIHPNLSLLLPTSGSTGNPKIVKLSKKNILSNAVSISNYLSINHREKAIMSLPMHYSYGLSIINSHLMSGARILLTEKSIVEKKFWDFLKTQKATSLSGVPYTFETLFKLKFFDMSLPHLKMLTQAGGKLNKDLSLAFAKFCLKKQKKFFVMYGQTEASPRMSYLPPNLSIKKNGSIGIPIPGGKFELIDDKGKLIDEPDKIGELIYYGPNVFMGYANNSKDLEKNSVNNGKLFTGDIARRDKDNVYYIEGRKKRFVKIFGQRVNLDSLELLLKDDFGQCICIGNDERITIFSKKKDKKDLIIKFISDLVKINMKVLDFKHIIDIPKTSSGKINYKYFKKYGS